MSVYAFSAETSDERLVPVSESSGVDKLSESLTIDNGFESSNNASASSNVGVDIVANSIL